MKRADGEELPADLLDALRTVGANVSELSERRRRMLAQRLRAIADALPAEDPANRAVLRDLRRVCEVLELAD